ncbi:Rieske (2Fe-2S) protein [Nocardioides marmotae]|uniref:Cytochrome bc1 complex Rieske iron-sulfur subunit n=1 Tax=Nocardioides marmotae TaxID=2663857 RepID=A0A6I3J8B6_9ACTN|nr:Rieske (2Fe-2S) protein [Nocardioides marmotae]MCR6031032.1 Rieske 2Fe-2S domain-containing protein [Gordonia jinghuaiqii]MBC9731745.1 Rieske (2Fe-2S) protein [Nocardioides marmotae]MTB82867.1 Rieske 2Fe-2S domain-containing protein [Nocardioides marmotae]MTB94669.1 Rieske 2Fe-2S domain-containing protein [Nocardioides marmotae]QKE01326.1 Rieske (2Fe-2S) protein [Nocardioides marmotae]
MSEKLPLDPLTRRRALTGAAGIGIALPVLAACGGDDEGATATDPASKGSSGSGGAGAGSGDTGGGAEALAATGDIEVGRGAIYPNEEVVVTQPSEGEFKAFSIVCSHQGCAVSEVSEDGIVCPCHNSIFSISDGSPQTGPATAPLQERAISVEDGQITLL